MYSVSIVLSQLSYFARLRSRQIIVLVSVLPEFAEQSRLLCQVSVYFGSRLLSIIPLSKSFQQCFETNAEKKQKQRKKRKKRTDFC